MLVGPEEPLTLGLVDEMRALGIAVFGPGQIAAQLESSKSFAKEMMHLSGVPTGNYERFETPEAALTALEGWPESLVVKADGLAAGKGVVVCQTRQQAIMAIQNLSSLNQPLLFEEMLEGPEISLFALVNGRDVVPLTTAQDHKRVGEGDTGPNTGGMGAYSPGVLPSDLTLDGLVAATVTPIAETMADRGTPFVGVMFVGIMLTQDGPKVLEYNVRFGDPECQVLMPRMRSALLPVIRGLMAGECPRVEWRAVSAMTVVLAAKGYPGAYQRGDDIDLPQQIPADTHLIHAGTKHQGGRLLTNGGRVMNAVGIGPDLQIARNHAYELAEQVTWPGRFYRSDIGWRELV